MLLTDGAFRDDGTFIASPPHDAVVLEAAWQRAVLTGFVDHGWLEQDAAQAMLAWPHSGFGAHIGPPITGDDRDGLLRVARYSARAPIAESRLRYDAERAQVELVSDRNDGPYAGTHHFAALEFLARWVDHVPERYETRVRYDGAYATRRRVWWQRRGIVLAGAPPPAASAAEPAADWPALRARRRRWAELRRRDADPRVHHRVGGRAPHPRAARARRDRCARRTVGGRGAGARLSDGGAGRAAGEERAPEGGREHAASARATGPVRAGGRKARRAGQARDAKWVRARLWRELGRGVAAGSGLERAGY